MTAIDEYVRQVMESVPPASPERGRIEIDVRAHLEETVAAEDSVPVAIGRMGPPRDVALAYLDNVPLQVASVGTRILAFLIDFFVGGALVLLSLLLIVAGLLLVASVFFSVFGAMGVVDSPPAREIGTGAVIIIGALLTVMLLSVAYFPVLEWRYGQTLGKWLLGIHVVKEDGSRIRLVDAIVRRIPFFLEFFWIDAIVAFFTERKQRAFDLVARTIVVECGEAPTRQPAQTVTPAA